MSTLPGKQVQKGEISQLGIEQVISHNHTDHIKCHQTDLLVWVKVKQSQGTLFNLPSYHLECPDNKIIRVCLVNWLSGSRAAQQPVLTCHHFYETGKVLLMYIFKNCEYLVHAKNLFNRELSHVSSLSLLALCVDSPPKHTFYHIILHMYTSMPA